MTIKFTCPDCSTVIPISYTPGRPAKTYGPPENCYPAEPDEWEPEECECGRLIDWDDIEDAVQKEYEACNEPPDRDDGWRDEAERESF